MNDRVLPGRQAREAAGLGDVAAHDPTYPLQRHVVVVFRRGRVFGHTFKEQPHVVFVLGQLDLAAHETPHGTDAGLPRILRAHCDFGIGVRCDGLVVDIFPNR